MVDLFGQPQEVRDFSGKVRDVSSGLLGSPKGKGKSGRTGLSLAVSPAKSGGLPFPQVRASGRNLHDEAMRLRNEIEKAEAERSTAEALQAPFKARFELATDRLAELWAMRRRGVTVTHDAILKAYDARVAAGHAWNPTRVRLQDAERWLKALRSELTNINLEIG